MRGGGCACIDSVTATYFRPDAPDKFLVGDFYGTRPIDPDNFPQRASDESLEDFIERACRRVPKLENAEVMRGVTGVYDMTPDCAAVAGRSTGNRRAVCVRRIFGHGLQDLARHRACHVGIVARRSGQAVDIRAFGPSRFAENKPIKAELRVCGRLTFRSSMKKERNSRTAERRAGPRRRRLSAGTGKTRLGTRGSVHARGGTHVSRCACANCMWSFAKRARRFCRRSLFTQAATNSQRSGWRIGWKILTASAVRIAREVAGDRLPGGGKSEPHLDV